MVRKKVKKKKQVSRSRRSVKTEVASGVDASNPTHIFLLILLFVVVGILAIWMLRMFLYVLVIAGGVYVLYMLLRKHH
jgi:Flp pilus assembly protein TadB